MAQFFGKVSVSTLAECQNLLTSDDCKTRTVRMPGDEPLAISKVFNLLFKELGGFVEVWAVINMLEGKQP